MKKIDGRKIVKSNGVFSYSIKEASRQQVINYFLESGVSVHSRFGTTLGIILEHCIKYKLSFTLKGSSAMGFEIKRGISQ